MTSNNLMSNSEVVTVLNGGGESWSRERQVVNGFRHVHPFGRLQRFEKHAHPTRHTIHMDRLNRNRSTKR
jgi:hypothetical protein